MSLAQKEFIVTLKDYESLSEFYSDMETQGTSKSFVPNRSVKCVNKRYISRNTHYMITDDEARVLSQDPRVESVSIKIKNISDKTQLHSEQTASWNRSASNNFGEKNWGLYRTQLAQNIFQWGSESGSNTQTSTIKINGTGKNVDIVVVDTIVDPTHSEFTGRVVQYDWFGQHDAAVKGTAVNIVSVARNANIATIVTQAPHNLNVGAVINVTITAGNTSFNVIGATVSEVTNVTTFRYNNTGANVITSLVTGTWVGVYQYDSYSGTNNHATHVAAIIGGVTQGWAREANIYNLRHDSIGFTAGEYTPPELLIDYIRQFHATKTINPTTGRKNPTIVNNSWGFGATVNDTNPYTGTGVENPIISKIVYRGTPVTASGALVDTGISGSFSQSTKVADFVSVAPSSGNRIVTTGLGVGNINAIGFTNTNRVGLTQLGAPTAFDPEGIDQNDDAFWTIALPFSITYLTGNYNTIHVSSNSFVTFDIGSLSYYLSLATPTTRKIMVSAGDRSASSIWTGTFGTAPNRTFVARYEGFEGAYSGVYESTPTIVWEMRFYENSPTQIDVNIVSNAAYRAELTIQDLTDYGINYNQGSAPFRNAAVDADITDAINDGIIFVGSAGNNSTKIDVIGGLDYNNYFVDNGLPVYYHRGSTPGASHPNIICVGNLDSVSGENKNISSNTGPRVDLYAPGTNIVSAVHDSLGGAGTLTTDLHLTLTGGYSGVGSVLAQAGRAALVVVGHGLTNGAVITVTDCSQSSYNVEKAAITVIDPNTFSYNISDTVYSSGVEVLTGTVKVGGLFQKYSGSSMSTAQVTGILALAVEQYPWMTQADAKNYILNYAKAGLMFDSAGGYTNATSLQDGNNRIPYYYKERTDAGVLIPKDRRWFRPTSGQVYPRPQIKRK